VISMKPIEGSSTSRTAMIARSMVFERYVDFRLCFEVVQHRCSLPAINMSESQASAQMMVRDEPYGTYGTALTVQHELALKCKIW
jgi:hypothetical protein